MRSEAIIGGQELVRRPFVGGSPFYPDYRHEVCDANQLDVARAIGGARAAERGQVEARTLALERAAAAFRYATEDVEHVVRLTGMPIALVAPMFEQIPSLLRGVPAAMAARHPVGRAGTPVERLSADVLRMLVPADGFCYAVTPGNDPRAAAMVAAILCYLGIPFVIKGSRQDGAARLVIRALIDGGLDPRFCNLLYFDSDGAEAARKHWQLLDGCAVAWVFGSDQTVDRTLRYELTGRRLVLDAAELSPTDDVARTVAALAATSNHVPADRIHVEDVVADHFAGKIVLRHGSGNCAAIVAGRFDDAARDFLYRSIGYAIGCNATKSAMIVDAPDWLEAAATYLGELKVGDPLDPETRVGYAHPANLDHLAELVKRHRLDLTVLGGVRLSSIQATPLVVLSRRGIPQLFGREIPAYVLAIKDCSSCGEAVQSLNDLAGGVTRLAVSLRGLPATELAGAVRAVQAHTVLVDEPTTRVVPVHHEGNDYALALSRGKLIVLGDRSTASSGLAGDEQAGRGD